MERSWQRWLIRLAVFIVMAIICVPGLWIVMTAFRDNVEVMARPPVWIPERWTLDNFRAILGLSDSQQGIPVIRYFMNSVIISVTSTVLAVLIGMMGGYAFARYRFKGKNVAFLWLMLSRTVPGISLSLPVFMIWSRVGLIDTDFGVILVYLALNIPFTI
ncbi:MAG TPA: carbohydrate ABC transporter permease, partial [Kaistia sp.]|nr:carbohydrate ABC transporter permease [Kaistia sp.]